MDNIPNVLFNQDSCIVDYQTTLKCLKEIENNQKNLTGSNVINCDQVVKNENLNTFETTDDESMAVEALRQLGGMFNVVEESDFPFFTCSLCENKFHTSGELESHFIVCKEASKTTCSNCQDTFDTRQDYENHSCFVREVLACKFCDSNFLNKTYLEQHISTFHIDETEQNMYRCHVCSLTFPRPTSLKNHLKIHNYIPGRALLDVVQDQENETDKLKWPNEYLIYVDKNCSDITSYSYNDPSCLVQTELNSDINLSIGQEMVVNTTYDDSSNSQENDLTFNQIKIETSQETSITMSDTAIDRKRPHVCTHCGATFARSKALSSHQKLHIIGWTNKHECETCGETFETEQLKLNHRCSIDDPLPKKPATEPIAKKVLNRIGKHPCPECQKKFTTKQKMHRHLWIHRKKTYSCEMCVATFEEQGELDRHRLTEHPMDSPYVCQECGKCFASRQGLWEHGRVHGSGSAGLFKCTICKKTFTSRQGYLIHNRMHTGERPYGCRFCMKAFRDGGTLRKHERIHTGERPHVCPICMHDFNQKVVLREHVRWVHVASKIENSSGLFDCQLCSITTKDREELCAHIVKHSDHIAAQTKRGKSTKSKSTKVNINKDKILEAAEVGDKGNVCDMCGVNFESQKELMTHVQVHI